MPTTTRTVFLTDENGNPLIDEQRNMRTLSFSLLQGYSYRLVERASIVSATYAQVVGYSTATGQTITGVENASKFDVGDFGIVQYAISDRNNTIGYVTCEVTAVGTDSLTVNGIGISVAGADGKDGKDGAPGADGKDGAATIQIGTVTTGAAGSQASITNVGTANAAILNFTIPRGDTGAQGVPGQNGDPGADGAPGAAATVTVGQVTTLPAGSQATVTNSGTENAAVLDFAIPQGAQGATGAAGKDGTNGQDGADGAAATIQIGEVVTGEAGTNASVENTGTENAAVLKFTIPRGDTGAQGVQGEPGAPGADGQAATIAVGEVTTGAAGTQASVTNSGTENAAVLDFTIPQGPQGEKGEDGTIVEANPTEEGTENITKIKISNTVYNLPTGGGDTVQVVDLGSVAVSAVGADFPNMYSGDFQISDENRNLIEQPDFFGIVKISISGGNIGDTPRPFFMRKTSNLASIEFVALAPFAIYGYLATFTVNESMMTQSVTLFELSLTGSNGGGGGGLQSTTISIGELDTLSSIISQIAGISSSHSIVAIEFSPAQYGGKTTFPIFMLDIGDTNQWIFTANSCSPLAGGGFVFSGVTKSNSGSAQSFLGCDLMIKSNGNINLFILSTSATDSMPVKSASSHSASIFDLVVYYQ